MIAELEGIVSEESEPDFTVIRTSGGVAYEVVMPAGSALPRGERVLVFTHAVIAQDAHRLFGFRTMYDKRWFKVFLKCKGVGPIAASNLCVVGDIFQEVAEGLRPRDILAGMVKGVGDKTASSILEFLRCRKKPLAKKKGKVQL